AVNTNQLSDVMTNALQQLSTLNQSPQVTKLQSLLGSLIHPPTAKQISTLPQAELRSMMQTLQLFNYAQQGSNETTERDIVRLLQEQITQVQQSQVQQTEGKQIRTNPIVTLLQELQQNAQQQPVRSSMINLIGQY